MVVGSAHAEAGPRTLIVVTLATKPASRNDELNRIVDAAPDATDWKQTLRQIKASFPVAIVDHWALPALGERMVLLSMTAAVSIDAMLDKLRAHRGVRSAQRLRRFELVTHVYPDAGDKRASHTVAHQTVDIRARAARRWATGKGISVALIGGRVDVKNRDLRDCISGQASFVNSKNDGGRPDVRATAIASIIAGAEAGIAPEARILALNACEDSRRGVACTTTAIARALDYAIDKQVDAVNLDFVGPTDPLVLRLVEAAVARRIVVTATIGPPPSGAFPASVQGVLGVTTIRSAEGDAESRAILGPLGPMRAAMPDAGMGSVAGDAIATAAVTGIAALALQRKPHLPVDVLQEILSQTADPNTRIVDACAALGQIVGAPCPAAQRSSLANR